MDKATLLAKRLGVDTYDIPDVGTVTFRGLSRAEVLEVKRAELGADELERKMLAAAMVDPPLTEEDVAEWQAACPAGELDPITDRIVAMSGMSAAVAKTAVKRFRGKS